MTRRKTVFPRLRVFYIFCVKRKIQNIGALPPHVMFYIFETMIRPITTYGSDVWGCQVKNISCIDKEFLEFSKRILRVKTTTCNTIVYGECGHLPPSVFCHINALSFAHRLKTLPAGTLAKSVYTELEDLHHQGFKTWVSRIEDMVDSLGVTMGGNVNEFKRHCRSQVINDFINKWYNELNVDHKPLLRTYCLFKFDFGTESYLYNVKDVRYRSAISKLRASSHILEIERGRYTKPKVPSHLRLCKLCNVVEDEEHFVTECVINASERLHLLERIRSIYPDVDSLDKRQIFVLLMGSADARIQKWFGKFLYQFFIIRNHSHEILVGSNVWLLIDEWWFAIYCILASIYSTGMCVTPSCCARHTRSNFAMLWNQLLTVLAWLWFYCWMHF